MSLMSSLEAHAHMEIRRYPIAQQSLNDAFTPPKPQRRRHKHRNPFNQFYKESPEIKVENCNMILDGFAILSQSQVHNPTEVTACRFVRKRIGKVESEDLRYFTNLAKIDLSDNQVQLDSLFNLQSVSEVNLMCNKIQAIPPIPSDSFKTLEQLNLSYNNLNMQSVSRLANLQRLISLDLSGNNLTQLPKNLKNFRMLKELYLSGNLFSTDSVTSSANELFQILGSISHLHKLDLSYNRLRGIHAELLEKRSFESLQELDFGFNWVDDQQNLMYTANFGQLQVLIITGNPFAKNRPTKDLEDLLKKETGGIVINESSFSPKKRQEKLPYPRPIAVISHDFSSAIKSQLFGVELSKDMDTVAISELNSTQDMEDEAFPKEVMNHYSYKDIYTPTEFNSTRNKNDFFITQTDQPQKASTVSSISQMDYFRKLARRILGSTVDYDKSVNIVTAYKQLKHVTLHPKTYQTRKSGPRYAQSTASRKGYEVQVHSYLKKPEISKPNPIQKINQEMDYISEQLEYFKPNRIQSV